MERKQIVFRFDADVLKKFKLLTVEKDTSMQTVVEELVKMWIEKNSKS